MLLRGYYLAGMKQAGLDDRNDSRSEAISAFSPDRAESSESFPLNKKVLLLSPDKRRQKLGSEKELHVFFHTLNSGYLEFLNQHFSDIW